VTRSIRIAGTLLTLLPIPVHNFADTFADTSVNSFADAFADSLLITYAIRLYRSPL